MYKHAVLPTVDLLSGLVYKYVKAVRKIHVSTYQPILCDTYDNGNSANSLPTGDLFSGLVSIQSNIV